MWRTGVVLLAVCALAGCGGGDDGDADEKPPPNSRTPTQAERCLRADGFQVRGAPVNTRTDKDAPDHVLFVRFEGGGGAEVAFYRTLARARQLLPDVREGTKKAGGVLDESDRALVFWAKEPDDDLRERVWRCVFAG